MTTLNIVTNHTTELIDITAEVREAVIKSGIKEGVCLVFTPHTTGSVFMFENVDPSLRRDLLAGLSKIVPSEAKYAHAGDNAAAHLKAARMGASVMLPVVVGQPMLGQWQGVFFGEFDGPRSQRDIVIKVIAG